MTSTPPKLAARASTSVPRSSRPVRPQRGQLVRIAERVAEERGERPDAALQLRLARLADAAGPLRDASGVEALGVDARVVRPRLAEPAEQLAHGRVGVQHEVLVAHERDALPVRGGLARELPVGLRVGVGGLAERHAEPPDVRHDVPRGMAHHAREHGVGEQPRELVDVPDVPGRALAPALLALALGVAPEQPLVELAQVAVELLLREAEAAVPAAAEGPERDELARALGAHEPGLRGDGDPLVAAQGEPQQPRAAPGTADDEDGAAGGQRARQCS